MPAVVAVPFAIGFILVNAGRALMTGTDTDSDASIGSITIHLFEGMDNMMEIIWILMTMAVLWVGIFFALGLMGGLAVGADKIKGFGESIGRVALKAPLALPVLPFGHSILSAPGAVAGLEHAMSQPGGVKKWWENMNTGKSTSYDYSQAAKGLTDSGNTTRFANAISESIKKNGDKWKTAGGRDEVLTDLENTHGLPAGLIDRDKTAESIQDLIKQLKAPNSNATAADISAMTNAHADIVDALKNAAPAPAAPPPANS
jgi:hypothetical protein